MYKWKYPNINVTTNLLEVTDEMLSLWEKQNKECDEYNKKFKLYCIDLKNKMINDATYIWGDKSDVVRYLQKTTIHCPSLTNFDRIKTKVMKAREEKKQKTINIESYNKLIELQGKAINYLIEKGKIINVDFTIDNVLSIANSIAYDEAITIKQKELTETHTYIDFNGSDDCENCLGWDGISRRCQCGNRRVSWGARYNADFFLYPYIYGEAW